jgi:DNA-binding MarR family transcriptional regulator
MDEHFDCSRRILTIGNKVRRFLGASFAGFGLTGPQVVVLHFIYTQGKHRDIFQRDIEAEFDIRRSSVTSILNGLEQSGFIRRENVEDDGRLKKLTLTDKAVNLSKHIAESIDETNLILISNLNEQDIDCLDMLLAKINATLP